MNYEGKRDLRDEILDVAVTIVVLLVISLFAIVAVRFALS
jgi:hypothetical protein